MISLVILYYVIASFLVVFITAKIIPCGLVWIILTDYLNNYRDYCYLRCVETNVEKYRLQKILKKNKDFVLTTLKHIGQKDKHVSFVSYEFFGIYKKYKTESVFENFLASSDWDGIEIGFEFITMLEQAVIAYENRLKERLSLLFWIDYFKLLYQNVKTLIKRHLTTP